MFRPLVWRCAQPSRFPRVRGDVPPLIWKAAPRMRFSPRARGCSAVRPHGVHQRGVFPACAGMFLRRGSPRTPPTSFPRVRGDVPSMLTLRNVLRMFSPRARGCSLHTTSHPCQTAVFPACAGMFRYCFFLDIFAPGFPRGRGDVPLTTATHFLVQVFSPRARGCSDAKQPGGALKNVFPACAGMFPRRESRSGASNSFPRVCGDVPWPVGSLRTSTSFSPHARGCSCLETSLSLFLVVSPRARGCSLPRHHGYTLGIFSRSHNKQYGC